MKPLKFYKREAKGALKNNWGDAVIATLVYYVIAVLLVLAVQAICKLCGINCAMEWTANVKSNWSGLVAGILALPLVWGFCILYLGLCRGKKIEVSKLFDGYKGSNFLRVLITYIIYYVLITIGCMLFIIPGIILGLRWAMMPYILKDNSELKNIAALKESARIMKGHKWRLFLLYLSFIGWLILGIITLGIGFLWIYPYLYTTIAKFYEDIKDGEQGEEIA